MTLFLDTSVLVSLERGDEKLKQRLAGLLKEHPEDPCISFMAYMEFLYGLEEKSMERKTMARKFLWDFDVIHTTNATAVLLSALKCKYDRLGKQKSITDLFIASQALEHDLTLITRDNDFKDMAEIRTVVI